MRLAGQALQTGVLYRRIPEGLGLEGASKIITRHGQGRHPPHQAAQGAIQPGPETLQGWGTHSLPGQPVAAPPRPQLPALPSRAPGALPGRQGAASPGLTPRLRGRCGRLGRWPRPQPRSQPRSRLEAPGPRRGGARDAGLEAGGQEVRLGSSMRAAAAPGSPAAAPRVAARPLSVAAPRRGLRAPAGLVCASAPQLGFP